MGIIPDYEVHNTIAGLRAGKDDVMEFALHFGIMDSRKEPIEEKINLYPNPVRDVLRYDLGDIQSAKLE